MASQKRFSLYEKVIAYSIFSLISFHIIWCIFSFYKRNSGGRGNRFQSFYSHYVVLGPFFSIDRVKSSSHFYVSYKGEEGDWRQLRDISKHYFKLYLDKPWQYDKVILKSYAWDLMRPLNLKKQKKNYSQIRNRSAFIRLNNFVIENLIPKGKVDSIRLMLLVKSQELHNKSIKLDTVLDVKYNPNEIEAVKNN